MVKTKVTGYLMFSISQEISRYIFASISQTFYVYDICNRPTLVFLITGRFIFPDLLSLPPSAPECKLPISLDHDRDQDFIRSPPNCDNCDDNDGEPASLYAKSM